MKRFCDHIRIYRKKGDAYNPFPDENEKSGIYNELMLEGECKGETSSQNSSLSVAEETPFTIYINENDVQADNADIAYYQTNCEGDEIKLIITEVKRYEHNTIIKAIHLKDGDNSEQ